MKKEIIIPLTLIVCALILGGSYLAVQINKQNSIERQQQVKIKEQWERDMIAKEKKEINRLNYDRCVEYAENKYWSYMRLNGTEKEDGSIWASNWIWDRADRVKKENVKNCFDRHLR